MKKITLSILAAVVLLGGIAYAAPAYRLERSILPETTDTYYLGSTSPALRWKGGVFQDLTVTGTCTGCGSGGGGSSTPGGTNRQIQYNNGGTFGGTNITYATTSNSWGFSFSTTTNNIIRYFPNTNVFQWLSDYNMQIYAAGSNGVDITANGGNMAFNARDNGADQPFSFCEMNSAECAIINPFATSSFMNIQAQDIYPTGHIYGSSGVLGASSTVLTKTPTGQEWLPSSGGGASVSCPNTTYKNILYANTTTTIGCSDKYGLAGSGTSLILTGDQGTNNGALQIINNTGGTAYQRMANASGYEALFGISGSTAFLQSNATMQIQANGGSPGHLDVGTMLIGYSGPTGASGTVEDDGAGNITGSGTAFTSELAVGNIIVASGHYQTILSIADDEHMVVSLPYSYSGESFTFYVNAGMEPPTIAVGNGISISGSLWDKNFDTGTAGQILSSTVSGVDWVDVPSASLSGGSTNALTYWTSATTVGATTSPTVGFIKATSTTPSTFVNASTTVQTISSNLFLPSILNSFLAVDGTGKVIATTTPASALSGGVTGQNVVWTSATTVGASTTLSQLYFTSTSTTQANTFPLASTTVTSATNIHLPDSALSSAASGYGANGLKFTGVGTLAARSNSNTEGDLIWSGNTSNNSGKSYLYINQGAAANDNKLWYMGAEGGILYYGANGDTFGGGSNYMKVTHAASGAATIGTVQFFPDLSTPLVTMSSTGLGVGSTTPSAFASIQSNSASTDIFSYATTTGRKLGWVDKNGDQYTGGIIPVVSSCGSGASIDSGSNNNAGRIRIGNTALQATCTVTFAGGGWTSTANPPACDANIEGGLTLAVSASSTQTTVAFTSISDFSNDVITYQCRGF